MPFGFADYQQRLDRLSLFQLKLTDPFTARHRCGCSGRMLALEPLGQDSSLFSQGGSFLRFELLRLQAQIYSMVLALLCNKQCHSAACLLRVLLSLQGLLELANLVSKLRDRSCRGSNLG